MSWSTPDTRTAGDGLSAANHNQYLRDNLAYLFARPKFSIFRDNAGNYSTSSTSFVDVDGTNLTATVTLSGSAVLLGFAGVKVGQVLDFDFSVDGTRLGAAGADGLGHAIPDIGGPLAAPCFLMALATGLGTGSHVFRVQWKVTAAGTGTLYAGAGSAGTDYIPHFWGLEVG